MVAQDRHTKKRHNPPPSVAKQRARQGRKKKTPAVNATERKSAHAAERLRAREVVKERMELRRGRSAGAAPVGKTVDKPKSAKKQKVSNVAKKPPAQSEEPEQWSDSVTHEAAGYWENVVRDELNTSSAAAAARSPPPAPGATARKLCLDLSMDTTSSDETPPTANTPDALFGRLKDDANYDSERSAKRSHSVDGSDGGVDDSREGNGSSGDEHMGDRVRAVTVVGRRDKKHSSNPSSVLRRSGGDASDGSSEGGDGDDGQVNGRVRSVSRSRSADGRRDKKYSDCGGWMTEVLLSDVLVVNNVLNDPGPAMTVMTVTRRKMMEATIAVIVREEEKSMLLLG